MISDPFNHRRYYVVVDERDPPGDTNWTLLTDKVTANRLHIPYYVTASFSTETLIAPTTVKIGEGQVIGGYLNYPLQKGKTYNYEVGGEMGKQGRAKGRESDQFTHSDIHQVDDARGPAGDRTTQG